MKRLSCCTNARNPIAAQMGKTHEICLHSSLGISLVIVLGSLVFLSALVVAFLVQMTTELKSSRIYADGAAARILSQSASNIVLTQIKEATKGVSGSSPLAWASQPGMIRTYDDSGDAFQYFKLYSDAKMVGDGEFNLTAEPDLANWSDNRSLYTDLNQPVVVGTEKVYPIIDGNLTEMTFPAPVGKIQTYNSDADSNTPDIDGFYVKNAPIAPGVSPNPVPMPVKWLYVLANGEVVAPVAGSGNSVVVPGADKSAIVGRVAFWTDDESSKINVNTASEGVYWDTPRVKTKQDDVLKVNQPVNGEYQRYPGHPAMTSLSTVIKRPSGWTTGVPIPSFTGGAANAVSYTLCTAPQWLDYQWGQRLYNVVPRIGTGGSYAGSVQTAMLLTGTTPPNVSLDSDRIYASVDELIFQPNRIANDSQLSSLGVLSKSLVARSEFFLTSSSRAPDVNLFNEPRVCIWPIRSKDTTQYRTPFDSLIAFCSQVGGYDYFFQRDDPNSQNTDLNLGRNMLLLNYLRSQANKNVPGFGGNFATKYPTDKDQIFTEIFDYIRSTNLRDALLVHPTDELKSTCYTVGSNAGAWKNYQTPTRGTNGIGQVVPIYDSSTNTRGFGRYLTLQGASVHFIGQVDGDGPLCPIDNISKQPTAPYPTAENTQADPITGRPLPYYSAAVVGPPAVAPQLRVDSVAAGHMRVQAMFLPQFFCPSVGATWIRQNMKWSVDLSGLSLNGGPLDFPSNLTTPIGGTPKIYTMNQWPFDETGYGDQLGLIQAVQSASGNLLSTAIDVPKGDMFLTGTAVVKIYAPDSTLIQTISLNFDTPKFTTPALAYDRVANRSGYSPYNFDDALIHYVNYRSFASSTGRYNAANPSSPIAVSGGRIFAGTRTRQAGGFIMAGDAIRSSRLVSGDARLVAGQSMPPGNLFEPNSVTDNLLGAHSFMTGYGNSYYGAGFGKLVPDLPYSGSGITLANGNTPDDGGQMVFFNSGYAYGSDGPLNGVEAGSSTGIPGDWDNGPFAVRDGPYINKADEGDVGGGGPAMSDLKEPYFWKLKAQSGGTVNTALFTPNRIVPSAVTFGSLPTGIKAGKAWQTLLFRPEPGHPGSGKPSRTPVRPPYDEPPDHLLLESFSMPVVEPYAISEPMSTAGRISMNYQILPFSYINRDTGIRALLKSEKVVAISDSQAPVYKSYRYSNPVQSNARFDVNAEETLKGFTARFNSGDIFRSASEICDLPIVPMDTSASYANMSSYWSSHRLTGDNSKERIYATLYPRLTTKSNTFTIHIRAQSLKKASRIGSDPKTWTENIDQVSGEYRGSQTVERYIDPNHVSDGSNPNDPPIPDYASQAPGSLPLSTFYRFRVVNTKQFAP